MKTIVNKKWMFVAVTIAALAFFAYRAFEPAAAPPATAAPRPAYVAAEGKVEALPGYDVDLGTGELNGRIASIPVKEGEQVRQGQIVALLENEDLAAQVKQSEQDLVVANSRLRELEAGARPEEILAAAAALDGAHARLRDARHQFERHRDLAAKRMVSQSTLDERESAFKAAEAAVKEAEQRKKILEDGPRPETVRLYREQVRLARTALDYARKRLDKTLIRSPIAGTVIKRYLDEGEGVTPEIPILAVADLGKVWINAEVDETDVGRVSVGDVVEIGSDAHAGRHYQGRVRDIAHYAGARKIRPSNPAVNLGLKVVEVKIDFQEPTPLRLGMTVNVKISPAGS